MGRPGVATVRAVVCAFSWLVYDVSCHMTAGIMAMACGLSTSP